MLDQVLNEPTQLAVAKRKGQAERGQVRRTDIIQVKSATGIRTGLVERGQVKSTNLPAGYPLKLLRLACRLRFSASASNIKIREQGSRELYLKYQIIYRYLISCHLINAQQCCCCSALVICTVIYCVFFNMFTLSL